MSLPSDFPPFRKLERQCVFVYWDQPYSGSSRGSIHPAPFSVDRAVTATEQVISLIETRYHDPKIVLFGHSWGGTLGTAYLLDAARQAGVAGWIEMDGGHNMPLAQDAYDHLGTPVAEKKIVILPNSGHGPSESDFPLVEQAVKAFLETL